MLLPMVRKESCFISNKQCRWLKNWIHKMGKKSEKAHNKQSDTDFIFFELRTWKWEERGRRACEQRHPHDGTEQQSPTMAPLCRGSIPVISRLYVGKTGMNLKLAGRPRFKKKNQKNLMNCGFHQIEGKCSLPTVAMLRAFRTNFYCSVGLLLVEVIVFIRPTDIFGKNTPVLRHMNPFLGLK